MTKRFGKLLGQGISSVARRQETTMRTVQERIGKEIGVGPDMVSYWARGNVPEPDRIEVLVRFCIENGYVNQAWAQSLLTQAGYPERDQFLKNLFQTPSATARILISYNGHVKPDLAVALELQALMSEQGFNIFGYDVTQATNAWFHPLDRQTKAGDLLVVLLSEGSVESEVIHEMLSQADQYRQTWGWLKILPIRLAYLDVFPYLIDSLLDPRQYVIWKNSQDNAQVIQEILEASQGRLQNKSPLQPQSVALGSPDEEKLAPPLPQFDPRVLEAPGGAVKLRDPLYIRRDADHDLENEIIKWGTTTTIQAPRQTGKSSLLVRAMHYARDNGSRVINLDMQTVSRDDQQSADRFLLYLAKFITRSLRLSAEQVDKAWRSSLGPQDKLTYLLEDYILPESEGPIILAIDEADRLLKTDFAQDFFSLLRSWHNKRALEEVWEKLNIILVISTEPYLLIREPTQSPFNVGLKLYLDDFNDTQVKELNRRHGSPLERNELANMMILLNGHPYLTRQALYHLVTKNIAWSELAQSANRDRGPFSDHLWRNYLLLRDSQDLSGAMQQIMRQHSCTDEMAFSRLLRAGLVKGTIDACDFRCDLYRTYFESRLV